MPSLGAAAAIPVTGTPTTPKSSSMPCCFKHRATNRAPSISAILCSSCSFQPSTLNSPLVHHSTRRTDQHDSTGVVCTRDIHRQTLPSTLRVTRGHRAMGGNHVAGVDRGDELHTYRAPLYP